jgi:hypothetical protein
LAPWSLLIHFGGWDSLRLRKTQIRRKTRRPMMIQSSPPFPSFCFPAMPLPSRKNTVTPIVVAVATPPRNASEFRFASALVAKKVAVTICGPALITTAIGRTVPNPCIS